MDLSDPKTLVRHLEDDMMKLLSANIRLPVLHKRLAEAAQGIDGERHWPRFKAFGGGSSSQYVSDSDGRRERIIVLRFFDRAAAHDLATALKSVRNGITKLTVLTEIKYQEAERGEGGIVTISFPEPRR